MAPTFTNFIWNTPTTSSSEPYRVRASKALEYIDWDALALKALQTRNGVPCQVGVQSGFGGRHVVREIVFDDDTHWIARVSIPGVNFNHTEQYIPKRLSETWPSTREAKMQSEIDTVSYVSEFTDIPIPRIFAFDFTATNSVGAPYMLMECCKGTCGMDMPDSFADITPQFRDKYYNAEGAILVKLWTLEFDKIGSIFKNSETGEYEIGPLPDGLGGPYQTATEFYRAWAQKMLKPDAASNFLSRLESAAPMISQHDRGPFRLVHPDFGHNNIIVDDELNVLGVIDWEKSFVGPCEMASRFPIRCLMYPDAIYPLARDSDGTILNEGWRERYERQRRLVSAIEFHEDRLSVSQRFSTGLYGPSADIIYLMRMWEDGKPWLLNYQAGVEDGVASILLALKESHTIEKN